MHRGHEPEQSAGRATPVVRLGSAVIAVDAGAPPEATPRALPAGAFLFVLYTQ
jgi:hypothetical protein